MNVTTCKFSSFFFFPPQFARDISCYIAAVWSCNVALVGRNVGHFSYLMSEGSVQLSD